MDANTFIALVSSVLIGGALVFKKPTGGNLGTHPRREQEKKKERKEAIKNEMKLSRRGQLWLRVHELQDVIEAAQEEGSPRSEIDAFLKEMGEYQEELEELEKERKPVYLGFF